MNCSQCGKEIMDPYCEEACPKHLCQECGEKCIESLPDNVDDYPSAACEECPYEPNPDYGPEDEEPTPEEIQDSIDENAEQEFEEE